MLHRNSNTTIQSIFFSFVPHNDTRIKESKVSKLNEAHAWLLIELVLKILVHKLQYLKEWQVHFFKASWDVANWYTMCWYTHKIASDKDFFFTFMPQSLYKLNLHCFQPLYDQCLQQLVWHSYISFFITWIRLWTEKSWCIENKFLMH